MTDSETITKIKECFIKALPSGTSIDDLRVNYNQIFSQMYYTDFSGKFFIPNHADCVVEYINRDAKIKEALTLAYNIKHKVDFYDLICASLIVPNRNNRSFLSFLYKEIVQTTNDSKILEIALRVLQKYNKEDLERTVMMQEGGLNPEAKPLIENVDNLASFIKMQKQCFGEIEISNLIFKEDSAVFTAYIMYEVGFSKVPKGSIEIELIYLKSINLDTTTLKDFQYGRLQISTENIQNEKCISCAYIHESTDTALFKLCSRTARISEYHPF